MHLVARLEAAFGEEPAEEQLFGALERGQDTYIRKGGDDRARMERALSAS